MKDIKRLWVFIIAVSALSLAIFTLFGWGAGQTKKINVRVIAQIGHSGENTSADDPYLFSQIWSAAPVMVKAMSMFLIIRMSVLRSLTNLAGF